MNLVKRVSEEKEKRRLSVDAFTIVGFFLVFAIALYVAIDWASGERLKKCMEDHEIYIAYVWGCPPCEKVKAEYDGIITGWFDCDDRRNIEFCNQFSNYPAIATNSTVRNIRVVAPVGYGYMNKYEMANLVCGWDMWHTK